LVSVNVCAVDRGDTPAMDGEWLHL
jgi:hypothetical protein